MSGTKQPERDSGEAPSLARVAELLEHTLHALDEEDGESALLLAEAACEEMGKTRRPPRRRHPGPNGA